MRKLKVTIDFDQTLSNQDVQDFVYDLIHCWNTDVYILTYRFDDLHYHLYEKLHKNKYHPNDNSDLYAVADSLGIPRNRIIFTNEHRKSIYLNSCRNIEIHLDDDEKTLRDIGMNTDVFPVDVTKRNWKEVFIYKLQSIQNNLKKSC